MSDIPYLCILDFEATCDDPKKIANEIIEFPSVLLKWNNKNSKFEEISRFQEYCKPLHNVKLTDFCYQLTGITQKQVDKGSNFPDTLNRHYQWICKHVPELKEYPKKLPVLIVTCGHWDMMTMMVDECKRWNITPPSFYRYYINIKTVYQRVNKHKGGLASMLKHSRLELLGRHHSGIDDSINTGRLAQSLVEDGYKWSYYDVIEVSTNDYKISNVQKKQNKYLKDQIAVNNRLKLKLN